MALLGNFLGLFYILLGAVLLVLFFFESKKTQKNIDRVFQSLYFIGFICVFILLIHYTYFQSNIDNDFALRNNFITLSDVEFHSPDFNGSIVVNDSNMTYAFSWENVDQKKEGTFRNSDFCVSFNNTDSSNTLRVHDSVDTISDPIYISTNTSGEKCVEINDNFVLKDNVIGVFCADCTASNTVQFRQVNGDDVELFIIDNDNVNTVSISSGNPAYFYIQNKNLPIEEINDNFWMFMLCMFLFSLSFLFRIIYNLVSDEVTQW